MSDACGRRIVGRKVCCPQRRGYEDLKSALVLFGGVIFATGVLLFSSGSSATAGAALRRIACRWSGRNAIIPKSAASAVADCLTRHDWARLRSIAQSQVPAIRLVAYHTPDGVRGLRQSWRSGPSRGCTSMSSSLSTASTSVCGRCAAPVPTFSGMTVRHKMEENMLLTTENIDRGVALAGFRLCRKNWPTVSALSPVAVSRRRHVVRVEQILQFGSQTSSWSMVALCIFFFRAVWTPLPAPRTHHRGGFRDACKTVS